MTTLTLPAPPPATNDTPRAHAVENCPLCGGRRNEAIHRLTDPSGRIAGVFTLRRCLGCELVYVDPRPSDDALVALYDEDFYFSTGWSYQALASTVIELIQANRRRRVEHYARTGRLLDIGCGDGNFVHHMARHGWDATGIDFSSSALEFARRSRNGGTFLQGSLHDFDFPPGRFDLITLWQVLEHIGEPRPLLFRSRELLKRGGLIVAAVPNIEGLSSRLTGNRWWGLDVPRHLVHYSPSTLRRSLEWAGFRVLRIRHRSMQYDPYALLHSSLDWVFTRRHFLSDLAKRHTVDAMGRPEYIYNVAALVALAPVLAPLSLATTSAGALLRQGGFIEIHARRE
jgi:2-polyprenyl-3-methyl-5-hydroxy-6-metoxy-1,4-benzoquinol methylase